MKKLLAIIALVAIVSSFSNAQSNWKYKGPFPDPVNSKLNTGSHGIQVDPDGKVWFISYGAGDTVPGSGQAVTSFRIFNADGTPASFNPIRYFTGAMTDTLVSRGRGLGIDQDGNLLFGAFNYFARVNYKTGVGMGEFTPIAGTYYVVTPGVDLDGNIYNCMVLEGSPAQEFQKDFSFVGNDVDTIPDVGRVMAVSPDGLTIYVPRFGKKVTFRYVRDDKFSPFVLKDSLFVGAPVESMNWDKQGQLWVDGGSYFDNPTDSTAFTRNTWYAYKLGSDGSATRTDSITWVFTKPYSPDERPRGIAFSPDGKKAYVACYGDSYYPAIEEFDNSTVDVKKENNSTVKSFDLSQNYPNPFNPSTEIRFSVPKDGVVSLKVYSILGQEVASLVNRELTAGTYTTNFNASRLASGTYIYQIKANGFTASKKMLLMK